MVKLLRRIQAWRDERAYRRKWLRWGKKHKLKVTWFALPECDPSEFKMPTWEEAMRSRPIITMLEEYVAPADKEAPDA